MFDDVAHWWGGWAKHNGQYVDDTGEKQDGKTMHRMETKAYMTKR